MILSYTRAETHIFMLENNDVPNSVQHSKMPRKVRKLVDTKEQSVPQTDKHSDI